MRIILLMALTVVTGCSLFRNQTKEKSSIEGRQYSADDYSSVNTTSRSSNENLLKLKSDSASNRYFLKLYPKGSFRYSMQEGFVGAADSMLLYGDAQNRQESVLNYKKEEGMNALEGQQHRKVSEDEQKSAVTESKTSPSWKVIVMVGVLLFVAVFITYRFIIR